MSFRRACTFSVTIFSVITLIVSLVFIGIDIRARETSCEGLYSHFNLKIGLPLLILSLIGLIGSCCRTTFFLWLYLCVILVLLVGILIFSIIEWSAIRYDEASEPTPGGVYRPNNFSYKLQALFETNWKDYTKCIEESKVIVDMCKFDDSYLLEPSKNKKYMVDSPFQWSCCIPPLICGYEHKNFNDWIVPKSGLVSEAKDEPDCLLWNNRENVRCIKCNNCKSLFLFNIRERLKQLVFTNFGLIIVFVVINLTIAVCAFKTNKSADRYMRYRQEQVKKACDPTFFPQP